MRQFYEKPELYGGMYGKTYICDHPAYSKCTLYEFEGKGFAVIQQRYDPKSKHTWWGEVDPWIADDIYLSPNFLKYYYEHSNYKDSNGYYPTVALRQLMWALKLKPLKKELWETRF